MPPCSRSPETIFLETVAPLVVLVVKKVRVLIIERFDPFEPFEQFGALGFYRRVPLNDRAAEASLLDSIGGNANENTMIRHHKRNC